MPLSQHADSREASPGIRGSQQGLVHLSHQQGPARRKCRGHGKAQEKGDGGYLPFPAPQHPHPRSPHQGHSQQVREVPELQFLRLCQQHPMGRE